MKKQFAVFALFVIFTASINGPIFAQSGETIDEKYRQLERDFQEKRTQIEMHFQQQFHELDRQYSQYKMEIYEKIENNPDLSDSEINAMYDSLISEFEEKRNNLNFEMMQAYDELEKMYENELRLIEENTMEDNQNYTEQYENDPDWQYIEPLAQEIMESIPMEKIQHLWESGQLDTLLEIIVSETSLSYDEAKRVIMFFEKYDTRNADGTYTEYDSTVTQYDASSDYKNPHENDPDWQYIEPLAQEIMESIPMEKIQHLWESGQLDTLLEIIVSETSLSYDEAKRVIMFFEKYDTRNADGTYTEYDSTVTQSEVYLEPNDQYQYNEYDYPQTTQNDEQILVLEQRIQELEDENQILRDTIAQLEQKIVEINAVLMEQVKFIYEWVQSQ